MLIESHCPRLRALDVRRITHAGRPCFLLRDPQQIAEGPLLVPLHLGAVLALCDGETPAHAIGSRVRDTYGIPLRDEQIAELLDALERAAMLENGTFMQRRAAALAAWRAAEARPMALAGAGYPAEANDLALHLNGLLAKAADVEPAHVDWSAGVGLLSPHIDYPRGGEVYARVWKRAERAVREAEVIVVFGTDHYGDDPVTLTRVPYATPYGVLPLDDVVVRAIEHTAGKVLGADAAYAGELRHRGEHSLELVLTWVHHMRQGEPVPVVPILVGSLSRFVRAGHSPAHDPLVAGLLDAVRRATAGRKALFVASGDLAHVGTAFAGAPLDAAGIAQVEREDNHLLRRMAEGDAEGFLHELRRVQEANNVCGTTPIYLTLRSMMDAAVLGADSATPAPRSASALQVRGERVGYAICPADDAGTSVVTVAGVLFHGPGSSAP